MEETTDTIILRAAREIFIEKGLAGARMQEIADAAGINKSLLHYYYRSKEQLFEAVFNQVFNELAPLLFMLLKDDSNLLDTIRNFFKIHLEFLRRNPRLPFFIIGEMERVPKLFSKIFSDKGVNVSALINEKVEKAVAAGLIKPISGEELILNMISLSAFQFAAAPIFQSVVGTFPADSFDDFIEQRKTSLAEFVINAIKK